MQTVQENTINYLVFPSSSFDTSSISGSGNYYILYAYQTMENDSSDYDWMSSSIDTNDRWRTVTADIITSGTDTSSTLKLQAGTTYQIELRYGKVTAAIWSEVETLWTDTTQLWSEKSELNTVTLDTDRIFVSGSVAPNQKVYVSSNEDATLKIYQG